MNLDQDKQYPQVGIGLGGYTWTSRSEAHTATDPAQYLKRVDAGEIPFDEITGTSGADREARSLRMALSTCQPLSDRVHRERFPGSSLLGEPWGPLWDDLADRGLVTVDRHGGTVNLTPEGQTLAEAIMNTEIG
jgi:oxygen-independent coproporphyrinogen-3 oxidase